MKCVGKVLHFKLHKYKYFHFLSDSDVNQLASFKCVYMMDEIKRHMPILFEPIRKSMEIPTEQENTNALIGVIILILAKQTTLLSEILNH